MCIFESVRYGILLHIMVGMERMKLVSRVNFSRTRGTRVLRTQQHLN
jgi:hypothetical protein